MIDRSRRVVLLIDYDNLQICASRDTPGRELQLPPVVQLAQHYGTVILARAYAEWNLSTERLAVYKAGIEPAFAPVLRTESDRSGKSLADTVMVAEGMDMLWTLSPDVVVLATSDKDLIPLVRVAKQRGAFVVVLGSDFTAIPLREMADEHVTYKQLITDSQGRYVTEAGPARQAAALPEPARRRSTRERNGRERTLTTTASTTPSSPPTVTATPSPARPEREAPPTPAAAAAATPAAEAVAPLTAGLSGESDVQGLGRRRRRRGSRRRSERIGGPGEGTLSGEAAADADAAYADGPDADQTEELSAPFETTGPGQPFEATAPGQAIEAATAPSAPDEAQSSDPLGFDADILPPPPPAAPAPRNRRRTARRPVVEAPTSESGLGSAAETLTSPLFTAQTPDILWATEPAATNGTPTAADAEAHPVDTGVHPADAEAAPASGEAGPSAGEPLAEGAAVTPRPRSRRVSSGARSRTRS